MAKRARLTSDDCLDLVSIVDATMALRRATATSEQRDDYSTPGFFGALPRLRSALLGEAEAKIEEYRRGE